MKKIVFNGMGIATNKTDVKNYRVIAYFVNNKGENCCFEISHMEENGALYGVIRQAYKVRERKEQHYFRTFDDMYNIKFLLTKENVLKKLNGIFGCNFDVMETIHYNGERVTTWK